MTHFVIQKLEEIMPRKKIQVDLYGKLLMTSFPYYLLALITIAGYFFIENHSFIFIFIIYALLPILDEILSLDWRNPTAEEKIKLIEDNFWFKFVLYFTALCDWILFFKMMDNFSNYEITPFSILNLMGQLFIFCNLQAVQFAIAHQIFHKTNPIDRFMGTIIMSKLLYIHFTYEHLWGHHKKVATPEDPASAQKGINCFKFMLRSFLGSYKSVYNMEKQAKKPFYMNMAILSVTLGVLFSLMIYRLYGTQGFILYLMSAFGAIAYLQAINYIEHYGLRRQKKQNGQYEKVTIKHSWNAPHRISNYLLFKLQRHSDHHENCLKPYQTLDSLQDSPQLSHGYSLTIMLSFFPSIWYSIMDPLVDEYNKTKTGNFDSQVRQKANRLIRYFIIQLTIGSVLLCVANYSIIYLSNLYSSQQLEI